jgi:hypothetical protein
VQDDIKGGKMKNFLSFLVLGFLVLTLFASSSVIASASKEREIIFESVLKDVSYVVQGSSGWWILKFENSAVIRVPIYEGLKKEFQIFIFWIGKKYQVSSLATDNSFFFAKLLEESEKEQPEKEEKK